MRSHDERVALRAHGGMIDDELSALGVDPRHVLDFSVNVNPYGPTDAMLHAVRSARIDRYPDPTSSAARRAIAEALGIDASAVVVGNGAVELMWTFARAFVTPGTSVLIVEPTFSELRAAVTLQGARVAEWRAREEDAFAIDLARVDEAIRATGAKVVYLCSPSNPTGKIVATADLSAFASRHEELLVLFDQSFLSLSDDHAAASARLPPNVVCVRSLTKDHAIPGLRVGYIVAAPPLAKRIEAARPPWTTSAPAQVAAIAAMDESAFIAESRSRLLENRRRLTTRLRDLRFDVIDSSTVYVMARVNDAARLRRTLLTRDRVLVRDCASFGLPHFIRVCARPRDDEERLVRALATEAPR